MSANRIGRYEILRPLGRGAMGLVYLARDPQIERQVALKTVRFDAPGPSPKMEEAKARFLKEARISGRLQHPHIVTVYDVGEDDGTLYLAMEYVPGGSLAQRLSEPIPLDLTDRVRIVVEVAEALGHAHERGVIHRDIKPANILLNEALTAKVTDFGIGKLLTGDTDLTSTGQMVGSPAYMSPEQIRGEKLDARSDIFSLGVVLYQSLTLRKPFPADTLTTLVYQILHEEPPDPASLNDSLPPELTDIVRRCLAKSRDERYRDAIEVAGELGALIGLTPTTSTSSLSESKVRRAMRAAEHPPSSPPPTTIKPPSAEIPTIAARVPDLATLAVPTPPPPPVPPVPPKAPAPPSASAPHPAPARPAAAGESRSSTRVMVIVGLVMAAAAALLVARYSSNGGGAAPSATKTPGPRPTPAASPATTPPATSSATPSTGATGGVPALPLETPTPAASTVAPPTPAPPVETPTPRPRRPTATPTATPVPPTATPTPVPADLVVSARRFLKVNVSPDQARLFLDGKYVGIADDWDDSGGGSLLSWNVSGRHRLRVAYPGHRDLLVEVNVSPSAGEEKVELEKKLEKGSPAGPTGPEGKLPRPAYRTVGPIRFEVEPPDTVVSVNGREYGPASKFREQDLVFADMAVYDVYLTAPGFETRAFRILVSPAAGNARATVKEKLKKAK